MAFLGFVVLLLIAMTIAASLHSEGPLLVILLISGIPDLLTGLALLLGKHSRPAAKLGGLLLAGVGFLLISLMFTL